MGLTKTTDHVTEALAHLITQFKGKPKIASFLTSFVNQIQDFEDAAFGVLLDRWIDSAIGLQLDGVGAIVGEEREGRTDEPYRVAIKSRIQINFSSGTPEDVLLAVANFWSGTYEMTELFPATFVVRLVEQWIDGVAPAPEDFTAMLNQVNAAGVKAYFQHSAWSDDDTFRFADGDTLQADASRGFGDDPIFVAVSSDGAHRVQTSKDGIAWTAQTEAEANIWNKIAYSEEEQIFVAVSNDGTHRVQTSPDGIHWTPRTAAENNPWQDVCWGGGRFVAVALSGTNQVMTSPDGIHWTASNEAEANQWLGVTYSPDLGLYVAVANTGTNRVMYSADGVHWFSAHAAQANQWYSVAWGNGLFVAVAVDGLFRVMTSVDGVNWTRRTPAELNQWRRVIWSARLGLFVAVSTDGVHRVMTSPDGITWTAQTAGAANQWRDVCDGEFLLASVSSAGVNDRVQISEDGVTWTAQTPAEVNQWKGITHGFPSGGVMSRIAE